MNVLYANILSPKRCACDGRIAQRQSSLITYRRKKIFDLIELGLGLGLGSDMCGEMCDSRRNTEEGGTSLSFACKVWSATSKFPMNGARNTCS